jgi:hypothetical protein
MNESRTPEDLDIFDIEQKAVEVYVRYFQIQRIYDFKGNGLYESLSEIPGYDEINQDEETEGELYERVHDAGEIELVCLRLNLSDEQKKILSDWVWSTNYSRRIIPLEKNWPQA